MSMHKVPLTKDEEEGLRAHGLPIGAPSQIADCFRLGMAWQAARQQAVPSDAAVDRAYVSGMKAGWNYAEEGDETGFAKAVGSRMRDVREAPQAEQADSGLRIVCDGPPGPESGRFVEVENSSGQSVNAGNWRERSDGLWELVLFTAPPTPDVSGLVGALEGMCDASHWDSVNSIDDARKKAETALDAHRKQEQQS